MNKNKLIQTNNKNKEAIDNTCVYNLSNFFIQKFITNLYRDKTIYCLKCYFSLINILLNYHDTELFNILNYSEVYPELYSTSLILTYFASKLKLKQLFCLWNLVILYNDEYLIFFIIVSKLIHYKKALLNIYLKNTNDVNFIQHKILHYISNIEIETQDIYNIFFKALELKCNTPNSFVILINKLKLFNSQICIDSDYYKELYYNNSLDKFNIMPITSGEIIRHSFKNSKLNATYNFYCSNIECRNFYAKKVSKENCCFICNKIYNKENSLINIINFGDNIDVYYKNTNFNYTNDFNNNNYIYNEFDVLNYYKLYKKNNTINFEKNDVENKRITENIRKEFEIFIINSYKFIVLEFVIIDFNSFPYKYILPNSIPIVFNYCFTPKNLIDKLSNLYGKKKNNIHYIILGNKLNMYHEMDNLYNIRNIIFNEITYKAGYNNNNKIINYNLDLNNNIQSYNIYKNKTNNYLKSRCYLNSSINNDLLINNIEKTVIFKCKENKDYNESSLKFLKENDTNLNKESFYINKKNTKTKSYSVTNNNMQLSNISSLINNKNIHDYKNYLKSNSNNFIFSEKNNSKKCTFNISRYEEDYINFKTLIIEFNKLNYNKISILYSGHKDIHRYLVKKNLYHFHDYLYVNNNDNYYANTINKCYYCNNNKFKDIILYATKDKNILNILIKLCFLKIKCLEKDSNNVYNKNTTNILGKVFTFTKSDKDYNIEYKNTFTKFVKYIKKNKLEFDIDKLIYNLDLNKIFYNNMFNLLRVNSSLNSNINYNTLLTIYNNYINNCIYNYSNENVESENILLCKDNVVVNLELHLKYLYLLEFIINKISNINTNIKLNKYKKLTDINYNTANINANIIINDFPSLFKLSNDEYVFEGILYKKQTNYYHKVVVYIYNRSLSLLLKSSNNIYKPLEIKIPYYNLINIKTQILSIFNRNSIRKNYKHYLVNELFIESKISNVSNDNNSSLSIKKSQKHNSVYVAKNVDKFLSNNIKYNEITENNIIKKTIELKTTESNNIINLRNSTTINNSNTNKENNNLELQKKLHESFLSNYNYQCCLSFISGIDFTASEIIFSLNNETKLNRLESIILSMIKLKNYEI